jgi:hypothetical protein
MTKPTESYEWATDAAYAEPGEAWDTQPTKVNPSAGRRAEGFVPRAKVAADYLNYLLNAIGAWLGWIDDRFETTSGRIDLDGYATQKTNRVHCYEAINSGTVTDWTVQAPNMRTEAINAVLRFVIKVPRNAAVEGIVVRCKPGATLTARGGAGNGVVVQASGHVAGTGTTAPTNVSIFSNVDQADNVNWQNIGALSLGIAAGTYDHITVRIQGGNDSDTNKDLVHECAVGFTCDKLEN